MKSIFKIAGFTNYLIVVFLNAFTDLGHKIIIQNTVFKVYDGPEQIVLTAIVNALILVPFVLVFSPSGFLADRFRKNVIMKHTALLAVGITLLTTLFYYLGWFYAAFFMTFLLALQSAIYSPAKYGYIKELVGERFLSAGNGAVQAVTTVSILSGIVFYTVLFELLLHDDFATKEDVLRHIAPLGWLLVLGSFIEWTLAARLPDRMAQATKKVFTFRRYVQGYYLFKNMKLLRRKEEIFDNIIVLSLFWSISQVILAIFGEYAKSNMGITNAIYVQGVMALSGIGIVIGSVMAAKLSKYYINIGIATVGAFGITVVVFTVPYITFLPLIAVLFLLFGIFSGFTLVPLNANIQHIAPNVHLGTIIAGNNFIQNIFMISFLLLTTIFAYLGMNAHMLFILMGFVGLYMSWRLFRRYMVMSFWAFVEILFALCYKVSYKGLENIPDDKAVLLLGNHVSWLDWLFLQYPLRRRINYMMDKEIYNRKIFHTVLKRGEVIPLSPKAFKDAIMDAVARLRRGHIVALFPEGEITRNCEMGTFRKGFELIEEFEWEGVVVPFYIDGMQGSIFARCDDGRTVGILRRREVTVCFFELVEKHIKAEQLENLIKRKRTSC